MAAQDELFQLIKSLNPSEKRYFKTNAKKGGELKSNYLQLFDAMDAQGDEYDEQLLKKKHAKKPFVKYLSAEKKYLREQIMKQMRAYRSEVSIDNKINELLQDERFYRDKGLKQHREKAIQKAKELATQYERFYLLQEILEREIEFVEEFEKKSLTEPVLRSLAELQRLSVIQQTYLDLTSKNREIFAAHRSGADIKDTVTKLSLEKTIAEVDMLRSQTEGSFSLMQSLNRAYSNFHMVFRNHQKSYEYTLNEYQLYQQYPHFKSFNTYKYKICLANLVSRAQSAGKTKEFLQFIKELKETPSTTFNEDGEIFQNVYFLEHLHHINVGQFEKAEAMVATIEEGLEKYVKKINKARYLSFLYNIMVMYFVMHRFKEASVWANKILEDKSEIKQAVATVTRILLPIIHFELGHHDLVENLTRAAYRFLKNKKRLHSFEKLMLNYLKNMPFAIDQTEFKEKILLLNDDLQGLAITPEGRTTFGLEEVLLWVEFRITNTKMRQLLATRN